MINTTLNRKPVSLVWTEEDHQRLATALRTVGNRSWSLISSFVDTKTETQC